MPPTTLTPVTMIDQPNCLLVVWINTAIADGAIGRMDVTARQGALTVWAIYRNNRVEAALAPGETRTVTFAGNSAKADDVQAVGCTGG